MVAHSRATMGAYTLRPLNVAQPLAVKTGPAGQPLAVRRAGRQRWRAVLEVQDCWRIDDEWWRERPVSRLYHCLLLEDGGRLTVYHDLLSGSWLEQREANSPRWGSSGQGIAREATLHVQSQPASQTSLYHELHLHTCFSFLEGASQPEELIDRAHELGYRSLAITDHDGLHGAMLFAQYASKKAGIRPVTGVELTLRHGLLAGRQRTHPEPEETHERVHLTLLAENREGYANLCQIITEAHRTSPLGDVALDPAFLEGHTRGLIALSGCRQGEIGQLVDRGRHDDALAAARLLAQLFGAASTYVELQHNRVRGDTVRVAHLVQLAEEAGLAIVATGNVHYHLRERHRLQDALVAIKQRGTLEGTHQLRRPNSEFALRSPEEMASVFARYPEAIRNTGLISERCSEFRLDEEGSLHYGFPDFFHKDGEQNCSDDQVLANYCWSKLDERYAAPDDEQTWGRVKPPGFRKETLAEAKAVREQARKQLREELALVASHKMSGFFLIYRDLQALATEVAGELRSSGDPHENRRSLPPGRGRGSSVSSIICYLIGLSHVDPVRHRLFFRRFLNEELQTVPDIDLDFSREIREQLILRVYQRYGHDHAALVCSFATYHIRSAIRDLGKVLGLPLPALDKLAKLSEGGSATTVKLELERLPEFRGQGDGPLWQHLIELAAQIDGFPRHVSQHVGGMIISSRPLVEIVPVQPASMEGRFICQWDKDSCDDAHFAKIDFLALGMLSLVEECLDMIGRNRGVKVDLTSLDYDDQAIYDEIQAGDTIGTFQIESRAQIQMLPRTRPENLDDLAVQVAIVRPGPIVANAVNPYVRLREKLREAAQGRGQTPALRTMGHSLPAPLRDALDAILRETLGVVIFQDQVLEIATSVAGFTPGEADRFRRTMSRRRSKEAMEGFRQRFIDGAAARGASRQEANSIFEKLSGFSDFGFPKSHAYAFAVLAYQSAWLRHYFGPEYYAALLNNQPMGFYEPNVLIGDAKRRAINVLQVSINRSGVRCKPGSEQLLLGLNLVRDMSEEAAAAIVRERELNGRYTSLPDFLRRINIPRQVVEHLIAIGALGEFGLSRRELLWQLGLLLPQSPSAPTLRPRKSRPQLPLALPNEQDMVSLSDMSEWERMVADYQVLRLSPSAHPMGLLRQDIPRDVLPAKELEEVGDRAHVRTAGMVVCRQRPGTAKGIVFLLLEDETGITNVVVRPDLYEAQRSLVRGEPYLLVEGEVQIRSGSLNLLAQKLSPLLAKRPPRLTLRHGYPGNPNDIREHPELFVDGSAKPEALHRMAPPSHDFH